MKNLSLHSMEMATFVELMPKKDMEIFLLLILLSPLSEVFLIQECALRSAQRLLEMQLTALQPQRLLNAKLLEIHTIQSKL